MGILRRTERAMSRAMCRVKLMDIKSMEDLLQMLGLGAAAEQLAKANSVRWYGHVLRREEGNVLRRALDLEVDGRRKRGRPRRTWKKQVEEECMKVGLGRMDALCRARWRVGVHKIANG